MDRHPHAVRELRMGSIFRLLPRNLFQRPKIHNYFGLSQLISFFFLNFLLCKTLEFDWDPHNNNRQIHKLEPASYISLSIVEKHSDKEGHHKIDQLRGGGGREFLPSTIASPQSLASRRGTHEKRLRALGFSGHCCLYNPHRALCYSGGQRFTQTPVWKLPPGVGQCFGPDSLKESCYEK